MNFSERNGYKAVREIIQKECISVSLKNNLWNALDLFCWEKIVFTKAHFSKHALLSIEENLKHKLLCEKLWILYFKKTLDTLSDAWNVVKGEIREYFFSCDWNEVYDFMEFVSKNYKEEDFKNKFTTAVNNILAMEMSAYRFVDGIITNIIDDEEINSIEKAIGSNDSPVGKHTKKALELLSDKDSPDYANSIKESISAVESIASIVLGEKKPLSSLINKLKDTANIHPALGEALTKLYAYTSDENGVRHASITDEDNIDSNEALFMLVTCSAFVNYIKGKALDNNL